MFKVDINSDLGESFGAYKIGNDAEVLRYVTSANIACGFHAGDPSVMRETVELAISNGVSLGAHPGLPDLLGFGRRKLDITPKEAFDMTLYQIGALAAFVKAFGGKLNHVKPHGALYNMAAVNERLSGSIAEAVYLFDKELILVGLAGSKLTQAGKKRGLITYEEVFADRTYQEDGALTPRGTPGAMITDDDNAIAQAAKMVLKGTVTTLSGKDIAVKADTICIHGDSPHALSFAQKIRQAFEDLGIEAAAGR